MKAVIYARYSSDNQREESIEGQLRECTAYCQKNEITVVRTYIDRALSAKTALPATAMIVPVTKRSSKNTASKSSPPRRIFQKGQRASSWSLCWRVWRNTTPRSWQRRSSGVIQRTR